MKIIVSVKQVPDTSGKVAVNPDGTLNRATMQTIINPQDQGRHRLQGHCCYHGSSSRCRYAA